MITFHLVLTRLLRLVSLLIHHLLIRLLANGVRPVITDILGRLHAVQLILLRVQVVEREVETNATDERDAGDDGVVPHQQRVARQGGEGLADGRGKRRHEEVHRHDERLHVLGRLGEGVLVGRDVGEQLGETDEDVL